MLFKYLDDFYIAYLDDILIYLDNVLEYEHYITQVLERLQEAGL